MVGLLHQARQQGGVRFPVFGLVESGDHAFDRGLGSDFALLVSANSVGQHKQPAVRAHLRGSRGRRVPKIIFVVVADSPDVGAFHEFEIKHMAGGGSLNRRRPRMDRSGERLFRVLQGSHSRSETEIRTGKIACPNFLAICSNVHIYTITYGW